MDPVSRRIEDEEVGAGLDFFDLMEDVSADKFHIVQSIFFGGDSRFFYGFFNDFNTDDFFRPFCQNLGNGSRARIEVEDGSLFIAYKVTGPVIDKFSGIGVGLEEGEGTDVEVESTDIFLNVSLP